MPRPHHARFFAALAGVLALTASLVSCSADTQPDLNLPEQVESALPADAQAQLQSAVEVAMTASGASGALVGVWAPWAGTWEAGLGSISPGGAAVSTDMTFFAGAPTRQMSCDVLDALEREGVVSRSDSVTDYVRGVAAYEGITLGQLCDATSSIAPFGPLVATRVIANPPRPWAPRELLAYGMARPGIAEPGTAFRDSDTGYLLLDLALESASRAPMSLLIDRHVVAPLGLAGTALRSSTDIGFTGGWTGTDAEGGAMCGAATPLTGLSPTALGLSGGTATTLADLALYTQALAVDARGIEDEKRFDAPLPVAADGASWFTATGGSYQAGSLIGQYGSIPGYLTAAFADRATGMTVVVVLNDSRASDVLVRSLAWQLAAIASKIPGGPDAGLPWTAEDMGAQVVAAAVCPLP